MGEVGHSTNDCLTLKHRVQNLWDTKVFPFQTTQPNVQKNPLLNHAKGVNVVFEFTTNRKKNLKVHIYDVYDRLVRTEYYPQDEFSSLSLMKERVHKMVEAEMIVYADGSDIVSTITKSLLIGMKSLLY